MYKLFNSDAEKYVYALSNIKRGSHAPELLEINSSLYGDKEKALAWKTKIEQCITSASYSEEELKMPLTTLNYLYRYMILYKKK